MRKLTEGQIKLVEDNYSKVFRRLAKKIKTSKMFVNSPDRNSGRSLAEQAISYLPQVAIEFKPERTKQTFADFATYRCMLRLSAEFLKNNPYYRSVLYQKNKANKEADEISFVENGYRSDTDREKGFNVLNESDLKYMAGVDNRNRTNINTISAKSFNLFEQQDFFESIKINSNKYFSEEERPLKALINDYLLPKCCGESYKSLNDIALELKVTKPALYQMLKGDKIKKFFNTMYAESLK